MQSVNVFRDLLTLNLLKLELMIRSDFVGHLNWKGGGGGGFCGRFKLKIGVG